MGRHRKRSNILTLSKAWRPGLCAALLTSGVVLVSSSAFPRSEFPNESANPFSEGQTVLLPKVPEAGPVEAPASSVGSDASPLAAGEVAARAASAAMSYRRPAPSPTPSTTRPKPSTTKAVPTTTPRQTATPRTTTRPVPQVVPPATNPPAPLPGGTKCGQTGWGLKPRAAQLANHIKARFPVLSILGYRASAIDPAGHPSGLAVDFMVPVGGILGDSIASYLLANKASLHVDYVIWKQRVNYGSGWKAMENRGSVTANHYDHVHVNVVAGPADISC